MKNTKDIIDTISRQTTKCIDSYRQIFPLAEMSKLLGRLLLWRLELISIIIPNNQFKFWNVHPSLEQVNGVVNTTTWNNYQRRKKYTQLSFWMYPWPLREFETKVWNTNFSLLLLSLLPKGYRDILTGYMTERIFREKAEDE